MADSEDRGARADGLTRVRYFPGQVLDHEDFELEQRYQLDQHRRHAVGHHTWGIVRGLELTLDGDRVFVEPGLAVDGHGRTVLVGERRQIAISEWHAPAVDITVRYDRVGAEDAARWREQPCFEAVPVPEPGAAPHQVPRGASPDPEIRAARVLPDDPSAEWPVHLGRILGGEGGGWAGVDPRFRVYAGLVGGHLQHPADPDGMRVALEAGPYAGGGRLAIYPSREHQEAGDPCVTTDCRTTVVHGDLEVEGDLSVDGSLDFELLPDASMPAASPWSLYRVGQEEAELRFELPPEKEGAARFVIGTSIPPEDAEPEEGAAGDGTFLPLLIVWNNGTVEVPGDLVVEGKVVRSPTGPGALPEGEPAASTGDLLLSNYFEGVGTEVLPESLLRALVILLVQHPDKLVLFFEMLWREVSGSPALWLTERPQGIQAALAALPEIFQDHAELRQTFFAELAKGGETTSFLCWLRTGLEGAGYTAWDDPCALLPGSGEGGGS